jgi:hypothetical protein
MATQVVATTTEATTWGRNSSVRNSDMPGSLAPRDTMEVSTRASTTGITE